MPLNQGSTQQFGDLSCVELEGTLAFSPSGVRLTEAGWNAARATLQRSEDLSVVIVLQEENLHTKLFSDAWSALPIRLASLAICPPLAMSVIARPHDAVWRSLQLAGDKRSFALWRCLVELAKSGSKVRGSPRSHRNNVG